METFEGMVHNNFVPQLQDLFTSQKGVTGVVPLSGAKLRVLIDPHYTFWGYIRRTTYVKYYMDRTIYGIRFPHLETPVEVASTSASRSAQRSDSASLGHNHESSVLKQLLLTSLYNTFKQSQDEIQDKGESNDASNSTSTSDIHLQTPMVAINDIVVENGSELNNMLLEDERTFVKSPLSEKSSSEINKESLKKPDFVPIDDTKNARTSIPSVPKESSSLSSTSSASPSIFPLPTFPTTCKVDDTPTLDECTSKLEANSTHSLGSRYDMNLAHAHPLRLPILIGNLPLFACCFVSDELFPEAQNSAGFDIIIGKLSLAMFSFFWLKHDILQGWTIPQADILLPTKVVFSTHSSARNPPVRGLHPPMPPAQILYVWTCSLTARRTQKLPKSTLLGPNARECNVADHSSAEYLGGYGVYFASGSLYNSLGSCAAKSPQEAQVSGLLASVSAAISLPDVQTDSIRIYTNSKYAHDTFYAVRSSATPPPVNMPFGAHWQTIWILARELERRPRLHRDLPPLIVEVVGQSAPFETKRMMQAAKKLARIGAEKTFYYDLRMEELPANLSKQALPENVVVYDPDAPMFKNASKSSTKFKVVNSRDSLLSGKKANKEEVVGDVDPILDAYRTLTGDSEYSIPYLTNTTTTTNKSQSQQHSSSNNTNRKEDESDSEFFVRFPYGLDAAICINGTDLRKAWSI
ncbi:hypothetical protein V1511DRAFT_493046 [Dipodascopsis uninucleata]